MITNIGMILLAVWLILYGLFALIPTSVPYLLAILAIITGILILTGR